MTQAEVWELVVSNRPILRREIRRFLPRERADELDEMYSDVVLARAQRIMELYCPDKGAKPLTYLIANCRWYAYKWVHGRNGSWEEPNPIKAAKSLQQTVAATGVEPDYAVDYDTRLRVQSILEQLPQDAANLLRWHLMSGFTFQEIGEHLQMKAKKVALMYARAFALARELVEADPETIGLPCGA